MIEEGKESLEGNELMGHAGLGRMRPCVSGSGTLSVNSYRCGLSSELQYTPGESGRSEGDMTALVRWLEIQQNLYKA